MPTILLVLLLAPAAASAAAISLSIPLGPAYANLAAQVAAVNGQDFAPRERVWRDRHVGFHDLVDNLSEPEPARLVVLVRRPGDKAKAAAAARRVLGKAASLVHDDLGNVVTVDDYLAHVVSALNKMNRVSGHRYTVDFGELRDRIAMDLTGAIGAVYIVRSPEAP